MSNGSAINNAAVSLQKSWSTNQFLNELPRNKLSRYPIGIYLFSMQASEYQPAGWQVKLIYPDTLRYRDSFNLQISLHFASEI